MMDAVGLFLRYLQTEKRYSPHTLISYRTDLSQFTAFLATSGFNHDITAADTRQIRSWVISMLDSGISGRSVNRKTTALRRFFRFCRQEGLVDRNPADYLTPVKVTRPLPAFMEEGMMDEVLNPAEPPSEYRDVRNLLILELLYGTGMRLSELIRLRDSDVDFRRSQIRVTGKRQKERIIPIAPGLAGLTGSFIECRDREFGSVAGGPLLLTGKGKPLYPKLVYRVVTEMLGSVTTAGKRSPHVLRHTYATHLLNNGAELNAIKELLGHANLSATQVYTHTGFEKLRQVYQKAHPRA